MRSLRFIYQQRGSSKTSKNMANIIGHCLLSELLVKGRDLYERVTSKPGPASPSSNNMLLTLARLLVVVLTMSAAFSRRSRDGNV